MVSLSSRTTKPPLNRPFIAPMTDLSNEQTTGTNTLPPKTGLRLHRDTLTSNGITRTGSGVLEALGSCVKADLEEVTYKAAARAAAEGRVTVSQGDVIATLDDMALGFR